jgi:tellurite resistance protein
MMQVQNTRFTEDEWRTLQFAILRVYFRVAQVDGTIDHAERGALFDILTETTFESPLLVEALRTIEDDFPAIFTDYLQDERDFITAMQQTRALLMGKLSPDDGRLFAEDLSRMAAQVGNASASDVFDSQNISTAEMEVIQSITSLLDPK